MLPLLLLPLLLLLLLSLLLLPLWRLLLLRLLRSLSLLALPLLLPFWRLVCSPLLPRLLFHLRSFGPPQLPSLLSALFYRFSRSSYLSYVRTVWFAIRCLRELYRPRLE